MLLSLVRHLPTEWNKKQLLQGKRDIPLLPVTEETITSIQRNLEKLKKQPSFDIALASTLQRTQQTAALYGIQPEIDGLLDELDFGPFEGKTKATLFRQDGENWLADPQKSILRTNIEDLEERIKLFLEKYKKYHHVFVFGHGSWIRAMLSFVQFGNLKQMNRLTVENNMLIQILVNGKGEC